MAPLSDRQGKILQLIVDGYISSGNPVPSMAIARNPQVAVSPATIRNDMVNLEEDGYIIRPHTSAGGVPADKGYRYFVDGMRRSAGRPPSAEDIAAIRLGFERRRRDMEEWADAAASIVAGLLRTLAFASAPRARNSRVKQVELLLLQELTVMLVVILNETSVLKQLIQLEAPTTQDELVRVRNWLSESVAGKTASEIEQASLEHAVPVRLEKADTLESMVFSSTLAVLKAQDDARAAGYSIEGVGRLFDQPELAEPGYGVALMDSLDDDEALTYIAHSAPDDGTAGVVIGTENMREEFQRCSVIVCRYGLPDEASGVLGLIGPTRMEYRRALPVVEAAASLLSRLITEAYLGRPPDHPGHPTQAN